MSGVTWGMLIDLDRCTGCGACAAACRMENNIPSAQVPSACVPEAAGNTPADWILVERLDNGLAYPGSDAVHLPKPCMHCGNPPCVRACPVGATQKSGQGGVVGQTYARCIGCRSCIKACPYGARRYNQQDPAWPRGMEAALSPLASVRPAGVVEKCTLCAHRLVLDGPGRYVSACAQACPAGAIAFGDVERLRQGLDAFALLPGAGTRPQVLYVSRRDWVKKKA